MSWASLLCQWNQKSALLHSQLHFLPPDVLTFFKTSQNSEVLGLHGLNTQWCKEDGLQFGCDVANAEARVLLQCQVYPTINAKTSWNSSFHPTVRLQRLWQRQLSWLTRLGLGAQSSTSQPSKANRRSMPVTVHRLPWATLRNQAKMDSV